MNCQDFESNVEGLAREEIMEASVRAEALAHGEGCEACARRLDEQRSLSFKLRALARETNSAKLPPMGNDLLTAFRTRQAATNRPATITSRHYRAVVAGAMAVAAMVLIAIAVTVIRSRSVTPAVQSRPNSSGPKSLPPTEIAVVTPDVSTPQSAPLPDKNSGRNGRSVAGKNRHRNMNPTVVPVQSTADISGKDVAAKETPTSITSDSAAEITTDFMPVGYASATTLQDGGQLVRVELPRSALVAFGLPMNVNRYEEKVKADVFFSADGMARAIRFVQ
ncbi:MAG TPA: hypothetical protein VKC61_22555 [Pyrinomonadaceae bacterium]|nr:hypothetical protein [Pyrinomonadaceae bacterium]